MPILSNQNIAISAHSVGRAFVKEKEKTGCLIGFDRKWFGNGQKTV
jgi:hypothetical protein